MTCRPSSFCTECKIIIHGSDHIHTTVLLSDIIKSEKENILLNIKNNQKLVSDLKIEAKKLYMMKPYPAYSDLLSDVDVLSEYIGYGSICKEHLKPATAVNANKTVYLCEAFDSVNKLSFNEAADAIRKYNRLKIYDIDSKIDDCKKKMCEAAKNSIRDNELLKQSDHDIIRNYAEINSPKQYRLNKTSFREVLSSGECSKIYGYFKFDFTCMANRFFKDGNMLKHIFINCDDNIIRHVITNCIDLYFDKKCYRKDVTIP